MVESSDPTPEILGPSGEPLRDSKDRAARKNRAAQPTENVSVSDSSSKAESPSGETESPQSQAFQVIVGLATDPRHLPAGLVALLDHDPMDAYRRRLDSARESLESSRGGIVATVQARLVAEGMSADEAQGAAARYVDQQFISSIWDIAYQTIPAVRVALVMNAALFSEQNSGAAFLASNDDVPTMWLTTRSMDLADRFGAWSIPVERSSSMPVSIALTNDNFQPLRVRYARANA